MSKPTFPTTTELQALINDRKHDFARLQPELKPPGLAGSESPSWRHMREREAKVERVSKQLESASKKLRKDFKLSM